MAHTGTELAGSTTINPLVKGTGRSAAAAAVAKPACMVAGTPSHGGPQDLAVGGPGAYVRTCVFVCVYARVIGLLRSKVAGGLADCVELPAGLDGDER